MTELFLYSANDDSNNYNTQGEGSLPDATYGKATGGLTDTITLTVQYPVNGTNADKLEENKILQTKINEFQDPQRLRITSLKKSLSGRQYEIKAEPIFNDIRRFFIPVVGNQESLTNPLSAFTLMKQKSIPTIPDKFKFQSDLTSQGYFYLENVNALEAFGGKDGSLLDTFGGEYIRDNLTLYAYQAFGKPNATNLVYGKNIQGLDMEVNTENIVIGIYPYATYTPEGSDTEVLVTLAEKVVNYETSSTFPNGRVDPIDFSQEFDEENLPTESKLRSMVTTYMNQKINKDKSTPLINVKVDFLELSHFSEYYDFQQLIRVGLGDTVSLYYPPLNIDIQTRVIKYEYDIVKGQYSKLELGAVKANFYQKLQDNISDLEDQVNNNDNSGIYKAIEDAVQDASDMITGNKGGNVVITPPTKPEEILIMDTPSKETAKNVLRMNNSGIGFSKDGYNGLYETAWTIDGKFNADFITAGTLKAINVEGVNITGSKLVSSGTDYKITIENGKFVWYSEEKKKDFVTLGVGKPYHTDPKKEAQTGSVMYKLGYGGGFQIRDSQDRLVLNAYDNNDGQWVGLNLNSQEFTWNNMEFDGTVNYSSIILSKSFSFNAGSYNYHMGEGQFTMSNITLNSYGRSFINQGLNVNNALWVYGGAQVNGTFTVSGTKSSLVNTKDYGSRLLYAYETPEYLFGTYGKVTTDDQGYAEVIIDPVFLQSINTDSKNYHVFTSEYGEYDSWVSYLENDRFMINTSKPNSAVSWNLVAYRKDYEDFYMETPISNENKSNNLQTNKEPQPISDLAYQTGGVNIIQYPVDMDELRAEAENYVSNKNNTSDK